MTSAPNSSPDAAASTALAADVRGLRVALIGTGFLGAPIACALVESGAHVTAYNRSGTWPDGPPRPAAGRGQLELRAVELTGDPSEVRDALAPADVWIACHASGGTQDRRAVFVGGAEAIVAAARVHRPGRVVVTSSTSALPHVDGPVDETEPRRPVSDRGLVQRDAEDVYLAGLGQLGVPLTLLRLAGLYGPGRELGRLYLRKYRALADGVTPRMPGHGHTPTNLVQRDDAVAAVLRAATLTPPCVGVVHVCDDDHRTRREMVEALAASRGLPAPRWEQPPPDGPPQGKVVRNDRMKTALGLRLRRPDHAPR